MTAPTSPLRFIAHDVRHLLSVAHLFPRGKGRRGVYALTFADGEQYAGQSVDIVRRYADHLGRWGDIVALRFAGIARGGLDGPERDLIHTLQRQGVVLRNITHALGIGARDAVPDLDLVVEESHQFAWLAGEGLDTGTGSDAVGRVDDPRMRAAGRDRFAALAAHPLGGTAVLAAQCYTQWALLRPRATEMVFWAASAMPSTNRSTAPRLLAVSVNTMETFVLGHEKAEPDLFWGFLNVRTSVLAEWYGSVDAFLRPRAEWLDVRDGTYEAGGGDVTTIMFFEESDAIRLLTDDDTDGVIVAARALVLDLMRKGPTLQWRWHNFPLADRLLEPLPEE